MKNLKNLILRLFVSYTFRKKTVYVITGLRRSGNHAFINWFSNAIENSDVEFKEIESQLFHSQSKKILHFNELNRKGIYWFIRQIINKNTLIKESSVIILSLEDYVPKKNDVFVPKNSIKISVIRSTLNLIPSRIQNAIKQAHLGISRGDMKVDEKFISTLIWLHNSQKKGWIIWSYDLWLEDEDYRKKFLEKFSFSYDKLPDVATHGGGSSFSGKLRRPDNDELVSRWKKIEWSRRILMLLKNARDDSILNEEEKEFIKNKIALLSTDKKK